MCPTQTWDFEPQDAAMPEKRGYMNESRWSLGDSGRDSSFQRDREAADSMD